MVLAEEDFQVDQFSEPEKLVLLYLYNNNSPIHLKDLFDVLIKDFNFSRSLQTLHSIVKKMNKHSFISWQPHRFVILEELGKKIALHLTWHMHLLEAYFLETLDLPRDFLRREALKITTIISCEFANALSSKYHQKDCELMEKIIENHICLEDLPLSSCKEDE
jgi:Mn-dependent DtxR family transcriptional regulator